MFATCVARGASFPSPFRAAERAPANIGPDGRDTPLALAADDELRESVRDWYRKTFGVRIDLVAQGSYLDLVTGTPLRDDDVSIGQAGSGLSHVPAGRGHGAVGAPGGFPASTSSSIRRPISIPRPTRTSPSSCSRTSPVPARPLIVETHSEMILLRARRWVAEERLPAGHVLVYWVHAEPARGSVLEKIRIRENGEMETWPDGVFIEELRGDPGHPARGQRQGQGIDGHAHRDRHQRGE